MTDNIIIDEVNLAPQFFEGLPKTSTPMLKGN